MSRVAGLLLAAGRGARMGTPKALVADEAGPWLPRAVAALADGGCAEVTVVLGAGAVAARALVPENVQVVECTDWRRGMSASLSWGLAALGDTDAEVVAIHLVDLPDVTAAVVRRVLTDGVTDEQTVRRAVFGSEPGHPVLIGRAHWGDLAESLSGDRGARDWLDERLVEEVDCADLATGRDVDSR
ncbi:nucleotidyltransferase family protein [Nocardioides limicola]|uniref:nucleotidyltransferase family protein n=1 Tax=Nocardioides limicola TaxID=2803368 RepID=UPI00193C3F7F|nr:nucleotidyltransferase family protein [Nocardioides sp. DJM-14]